MTQAFYILSGGVAIGKVQDYGNMVSRRLSVYFDLNDDTIWIHDPQYISTVSESMDLVIVARNALSDDQIKDRSKADVVAKTITSVQALWNLLQIVTRAAQGLNVSVMECATSAYIAMAAVSYVLWWEKAYDVETFHVIDAQEVIPQGRDRLVFWWDFWLKQDWHPRSGDAYCHQHRAWWSDRLSTRIYTIKSPLYNAIGIDLPRSDFRHRPALRFFVTLNAVFGGIHCAAWSYPFASVVGTWLWRLCSILTALLHLGKWQSEPQHRQIESFNRFCRFWLISSRPSTSAFDSA